MKVLIFIFMLLSSSIAKLITFDEIETLLKKLMKNELSEVEKTTLQDVFELLRRPEHISTDVIEYRSQARMSFECFVCRSTFATLIESLQNGQTIEDLSGVIVYLCTVLGIVNNNVCSGAVALNAPIIEYIIKTTPEATPATFCGLLFQTVSDPTTCPYNDPRFEWQVELPAPSSTVSTPQLEPTNMKVVVITDAHIDPLYEAYGVAVCDEPVCCRKGQNPANSYVVKSNVEESVIEQSIISRGGEMSLDLSVASEVREIRKSSRFETPKNVEPAGYWGDYRNCDTPIWAFDEAIDTITETHKDIDLVYYIGDTIDHGVWETSYELIDDMNRHLMEKLRGNFGEDILILPVIGNHESQPTNQFAPSSITEPGLNTTWLYAALADKWGYYLTEEAQESMRERGGFSMLIRPGLRVISINNNVAYRYNWWLVYDPLDAKTHLDWLVEELYKAEQAGEKVHILAHIPPGVHDLTYTWTREYNRIISRFASTITAEFNGHTHSDEIKIFYDSDGNPTNVAWGAGSVTSYTFYNLNYKIATINTGTYEPENIINYVYNLTEANLTPNRRPHWFQLYDMKNTFGLSDLSAASMSDLVYRMVTTDKHLLDMYAAFYSKLSDSRWPYCSEGCKLDNLCKTVVTVLWERDRCTELRNLFYSSK